jgi:protein ImuB
MFPAAEAPRARPVLRPAGARPPPPTPQSRRAARARELWYAAVFPDLSDAEQSSGVLQRLALHAQQFTSLVSLELPNALLLEIKGSLKLFGALAELHPRIDARWAQLAVPVQSATAPTTLSALWFARAASAVLLEDPGQLPGRLAELPLACTRWDPERLRTLRAMGVTRLGELLRLPRAGLARRLGPAAVLDLDVALGRLCGPRRAFVPRERFRERCDFESEIESVAHLEKAFEPLIERCAAFLRRRQAGVQALELKLRHRARSATRVRLGLASLTSEWRRLQDVLAQQLVRFELPAPVRGIELLSGALQALSADSLDAFTGLGKGGSRDTAAQLVERLRARLGEQAVYGVCPVPEHRPEAAWQRVREFRFSAPAKFTGNLPPGGMPRPVWLLTEPVWLPQRPATLEQGPERIESGWWDGKGVTRDYYIARQMQGERLWIFQERHTGRWYLHGVFA